MKLIEKPKMDQKKKRDLSQLHGQCRYATCLILLKKTCM